MTTIARLTFVTVLIVPALALAAPRYERPINLSGVTEAQPVFVTIPEEVTLYNALPTLRITKNGAGIPIKTAPGQAVAFGGVISAVDLCSLEGAGQVTALYDGDRSTLVRPDPLQSPADCTLTVSLSVPARLDGLTLEVDQLIKKMTVSALQSDGGYTQLGEARSSTIAFSSVITTGLRVTLEYDQVPALREITLEGAIPARILFQAEPGASFTLMYGDDAPPPLLPAPAELATTATTPFVTLGAERIRDEDADGDGLPAARDNCPFVSNRDQTDSDRDGVGDVCDNAPGVTNAPQNDRDQDGVGDSQDNCASLFNPDQRDEDIDGIGDVCDDHDGDGVQNSRDNCPGLRNSDQQDSDGNGIGDACELDRDSDGLPDEEDNCRSTSNPQQEDRDRDSIGDACDSCPDVVNPQQEDRNVNGLGDACEAAIQDPDSDSVSNERDNCPAISNPDQRDADQDGRGDLCDNCPTLQNRDQSDDDKDGQGDVCTDADGDGFLPHIDNCPAVANTDQTDRDNDGLGDACEDDDGDSVINASDNCPQVVNRDQGDQDADGMGNVCDTEDDRFSEKYPLVIWIGMSFIVLVLLSLVMRMIMQIKKDKMGT